MSSNQSSNPVEFSFIFDHFFSKTFAQTFNFYNEEFYQNNFKLESEIFNYFTNSICPGCICYPKGSGGRSGLIPAPLTRVNPDLNPYLYLVVPLAQTSEIVYKTLVAVAARQLSLLGNAKFDTLSSIYTSQVLKMLPSVIKEKQNSNSNNWDEVLATVLMLCFADISSSCGASWLIHLNGAKEFLKVSSIRSNITPVAKFFIRYFITHEVMGETAWFQNKIISDDDYLTEIKNDKDERIDLVLGCSPHLISMINRVSKLGEAYESFEYKDRKNTKFLEVQRTLLEERDRLEVQLNNLKQYLKLSELDDVSQGNIIKIAEIKRLTTLIYLFARIDLEYLHLNHSKNSDVDSVNVKYPKRFTDRFKVIKQITKKIMNLIVSLPSTTMSLLWPLFVIGIVSVENDEERWFVLSRLIEMERIRELASVKIARRVVESVWKEKDLNCLSNRWKDMIKGKANTISLA
ncbi:fungal-specific transcription factor domain-containing protein [Scheffersomyces xylosifermentans]|uniref:fungal-specific transcription factor domain-containing protein n=1 Tax=Scheffersomyces xylosifermentans TaxID=1304137 RepID=UPI00315D1843